MRLNFRNIGEGIGALGDAYNKVQLGRRYDEASKQTMQPGVEGTDEEKQRAADEANKLQLDDFETFANQTDRERGNLGANYRMDVSTTASPTKYGLGANPTEFRTTQYTPAERRTAGLEAQADFLAKQGRTEEASKLLDTVEARKTGALNQQLLQENVNNAGLRKRALEQGLEVGQQNLAVGAQGLARGAREASQADAYEKVAVLNAELGSLVPNSPEYKNLQRKIASQTAGLSLTDQTHIANLAKTHIDLEVATANRDWMKAAESDTAAVAHYNKMYKDNFVVKIEPAAGGKKSLVKYATDESGNATGKPISTLLTYANWGEEGRPFVAGNAPALAAEQWKLGTAHKYKMIEVRETGKQHIEYAKALSANKEIKMTDEQKTELDAASKAVDDATSAENPDPKRINAAIVRFNGMVRRIGIDNKTIGMIPNVPVGTNGPQTPSMSVDDQLKLEERARDQLSGRTGWPTGNEPADEDARKELIREWIRRNYGDPKVRGLDRTRTTNNNPRNENMQLGGTSVADNPALIEARRRARSGSRGPLSSPSNGFGGNVGDN